MTAAIEKTRQQILFLKNLSVHRACREAVLTIDKRVPEIARACLSAFGAQLRRIKEQILEFDRLIRAWHRSNEVSMRLDEATGVGPVLATAVVATVADPKSFRSGRNFSAWIGIVPRQHSSGGKTRLGNISKQGDRYLRGLFVAGALAVMRYAKIHGTKHRPWLTALLERRPTKVAAIALANKPARMGLGHDGQGRAIQGTRRACAVNEIAPDNRRDV
jgi:transposase